MSSSESRSALEGQDFVPDVQGAASFTFQIESAAMLRVVPEHAATPRPIEEYRPGPTPEEIRAECRAEFETEFELRLVKERAGDSAQLRALSEALRQDANEREDRLARQCVRLAISIAERLVRDRITHDPDLIERVVRDAVGQIDKVTDLLVFVNPSDAAVLRAHPELLAEVGIAEVREEPRQRRGGCRLESQERSWDASLVGQLTRMQEALEAVLEPGA